MWLPPRAGMSSVRGTAHFIDWEIAKPASADPGGSPFQMPARLADGLGLESDLDHGCPRSYAPSSNGAGIHVEAGTVALSEEFGSPALTFRKESQLRLLLLTHTKRYIA